MQTTHSSQCYNETRHVPRIHFLGYIWDIEGKYYQVQYLEAIVLGLLFLNTSIQTEEFYEEDGSYTETSS